MNVSKFLRSLSFISMKKKNFFIIMISFIFTLNLGKIKETDYQDEKFKKNYKSAFSSSYEDDNTSYDDNKKNYKPINCTTKPYLCKITNYLNAYFPDDYINSLSIDFNYINFPSNKEGEFIFSVNNTTIEKYNSSIFPDFNPILHFPENISVGERERIKKSVILFKMILASDILADNIEAISEINNNSKRRFQIFKKEINNFFELPKKYKEEQVKGIDKIIDFDKACPSIYDEKKKNNPDCMTILAGLIKEIFETNEKIIVDKVIKEIFEMPIMKKEQEEEALQKNLESIKNISTYDDLYDNPKNQNLPDNHIGLIDFINKNSNIHIRFIKKKNGAPLFNANEEPDENNIHPFIFNYNGRLLDFYAFSKDIGHRNEPSKNIKYDLVHILGHGILHFLGYKHKLNVSDDIISNFWALIRFLYKKYTLPTIDPACYSGASEEWGQC